jgi:hypothetical protein
MPTKKSNVKKKKEKILKGALKTVKESRLAGKKDPKVEKKKEKILKWADKTIKGSKLAKSTKKRKK